MSATLIDFLSTLTTPPPPLTADLPTAASDGFAVGGLLDSDASLAVGPALDAAGVVGALFDAAGLTSLPRAAARISAVDD